MALRWLQSWLIIIIVSLAGFPSAASAHAYLERSAPLQNAELSESPKEIRLQFTEEIDVKVSQVTLEHDKGNIIGGQLSTGDARTLIYKIPKLTKGVYKVKWQVLSVDTHVTEGSFRFSVGRALEKEKPSETISLDGEGTSLGSAVPDTPQSASGMKPEVNSGTKPDLKQKMNLPVSSPANLLRESKTQAEATGGAKTSSEAVLPQQPPAESGGTTEPKVDLESGSSHARTPKTDHETIPTQPQQTDSEEQVANAVPNKGGVIKESSILSDQPLTEPDGKTLGHAHHHLEQHEGDWRTFVSHLLRIFDVVATICIAGFLFFRYGVWGFVHEDIPAMFSKDNERRLLVIAFVIFAVTGVLHVWLLADQLSGIGTKTLWDLSRTILFSTMVGSASWLRPALIFAVFLLTFAPKRNERWIAGVKGMAVFSLTVLFPLTGHAYGSSSGVSYAVFSHTLHMLAAAVWFGGLTGILVVTWKTDIFGRNWEIMNEIIRRFSNIALLVVMAMAISGIALALLRLKDWSALLQSGYGRLVLAKIVILLFVIVIGAFHRLLFIPRMVAMVAKVNDHADPDAKALKRFVLGVRLEVVLVLAAIILAGILSTTAPPEKRTLSELIYWHVVGDKVHIS